MDNFDAYVEVLKGSKGQPTDKQLVAMLATIAASLANIADSLEKLAGCVDKQGDHFHTR